MSEKLYKLVNSLNNKEKYYFTKQHIGDKAFIYLDLYKIYLNAKVYDKAKFKTAIQKKWKGKNLKSAETYLEELVIKTIVNSPSSNAVEAEYDRLNDRIKAYEKKGFIHEIENAYKRKIELDKQTHNFSFLCYDLLRLYSVKINLNSIVYKKDVSKKKLKQLDKFANNYKYEIKAKRVYLSALLRAKKSLKILPNETEEKLLKKIAKIDKNVAKTKNKIAHYHFLESKFIYETILKKYTAAFITTKRLISLFEENKIFRQRYTLQYYSTLLHLLMLIEYQKTSKNYIFDVQQKIELLNKENSSVYTKLFLYYANLLALKFSINKKNIAAKKEELILLEAYYKEPFPRTYDLVAYEISQFAFIYFMLNDYEKCLNWINVFENSEVKKFRVDVFIQLKILSLMCHYHLKNTIALPYYVKSVYRFISSRNESTDFGKWFLRCIKKINEEGFDKSILQKFYNEFRAKQKEGIFMEENHFDYGLWLKSLIEKKTYVAVLED